jgi:hypothetical protein
VYVDGSVFAAVVVTVFVVVDAEDGCDGDVSTVDGTETGKVDVSEGGATTGFVSVSWRSGDVGFSDRFSSGVLLVSSKVGCTCSSRLFLHPCFDGSSETFSLTLSLPEYHSASFNPSRGAKASGNKSAWKSI